jgi:hypothetical protein
MGAIPLPRRGRYCADWRCGVSEELVLSDVYHIPDWYFEIMAEACPDAAWLAESEDFKAGVSAIRQRVVLAGAVAWQMKEQGQGSEWLGGKFSRNRFSGKERGQGQKAKAGFSDMFDALQQPVRAAQSEAQAWALNFGGHRDAAIVQASAEVAEAARVLSVALANAQKKMDALKALLEAEENGADRAKKKVPKAGVDFGARASASFHDLAELIVRHWCKLEPFPKSNKGDHGLLGLLEWWHKGVYDEPIVKRDALIGELRKWHNAGYKHR